MMIKCCTVGDGVALLYHSGREDLLEEVTFMLRGE